MLLYDNNFCYSCEGKEKEKRKKKRKKKKKEINRR